jgi:hypothetical protein
MAIIHIPGSPERRMVKVEFLLPEKFRDGQGANIRYIKSEIEKIAVMEGGATALKAPVEGLWVRDETGRLERGNYISFFTVIDITGREQTIGEQLRKMQRDLEKKFGEEEIFILVSEVQRI